MDIEVVVGRFNTEEEKSRMKRLDSALREIQSSYEMISPAPEYKLVQDKLGQVKCKMNTRMLVYLLSRFSQIEQPRLDRSEDTEPPEWFMELMAGRPYEHLKPKDS